MTEPSNRRPSVRAQVLGALALAAVLVVIVSVVVLYRVLSGPSYSSPPKVCGGHGCVLNQPRPLAPTGPSLTAYPAPAAASGHVDWTNMPLPDNQGGVGQCQCYAFRKQYERLFNQALGVWRKFSCRFWYSLVGQGQDPGSYFGQYVSLLNSVGGVFHRTWDYAGYPSPGQLQYPVPSAVMSQATGHRYAVQEVVLGAGTGQGPSAISDVEYWIGQGYPVNLDSNVYSGSNGFFNPDGLVDLPSSGDGLAGGHATTIVGYDRDLTINGVRGWFLAENNWGRAGWGRDCHTGQLTSQHGGCFYISYRYVERYGWGLEVIKLTQIRPQFTPPPPWHQPSPALNKPLPPPSNAPKHFPPRLIPQGSAYVKGVYAHDVCSDGTWQFSCRHYLDVAPIINAAARHYGVYSPGLLAVLGAECGIYTHSTRCDRYGGWPDVSFGACQVTVATAAGYGVGGGTSYWDDYVRTYENRAANCIWLAAKVLGSFQSYLRRNGCDIQWPFEYVAWNSGPGNPCWFMFNPTGQAGVNFFGNFMAWWRFSLQYAVSYDPYAPKPFPVAQWWAACPKHNCASPYWRGKLSWAASIWRWHQWLGGVRGHERYAWRLGHPYTVTHFQHGCIYTWTGYHRGAAGRCN